MVATPGVYKLAHYVHNEQFNDQSNHRLLVIFPLLITTLFCFGFVLTQSPQNSVGSGAVSQQNPGDGHGNMPELPTLPLASSATLPQLSEEPLSSVGGPAASTATPQPNSAGTSNLQSAGQSRQSSQTIIIVNNAKQKALNR
jgi:hypothetical protein